MRGGDSSGDAKLDHFCKMCNFFVPTLTTSVRSIFDLVQLMPVAGILGSKSSTTEKCKKVGRGTAVVVRDSIRDSGHRQYPSPPP